MTESIIQKKKRWEKDKSGHERRFLTGYGDDGDRNDHQRENDENNADNNRHGTRTCLQEK